jgi:hypothetical protein
MVMQKAGEVRWAANAKALSTDPSHVHGLRPDKKMGDSLLFAIFTEAGANRTGPIT